MHVGGVKSEQWRLNEVFISLSYSVARWRVKVFFSFQVFPSES